MSHMSNPNRVRYRPGRDNSVLKMVLHDLWKRRCYCCGKPEAFTHIDLDPSEGFAPCLTVSA